MAEEWFSNPREKSDQGPGLGTTSVQALCFQVKIKTPRARMYVSWHDLLRLAPFLTSEQEISRLEIWKENWGCSQLIKDQNWIELPIQFNFGITWTRCVLY